MTAIDTSSCLLVAYFTNNPKILEALLELA